MISFRSLLLLGILSVVHQCLDLHPTFACPGCQNPTLPVVPNGGVFLDRGVAQWGVLLTTMPVWVKHEAGCEDITNCNKPVIQPLHVHDQFMSVNELKLNLDWGLSEHLGLSFQLPLRVISTRIKYTLPNGRSYTPLDVDIHHRDETLLGLGDGRVSVRWAKSFASGWWLLTQVGSQLPLGRTEDNPFTSRSQVRKHQHIQMGTGTFDPYTSIVLAKTLGSWQVSFYGQAMVPLYENNYGFKAGPLTLLNTKVSYKVQARSLIHGGLSWYRQGAEKWDGELQQDGIFGRQEMIIGLGGTVSFGGPQYIINVQVPVWRELFQGKETERGELFAPLGLIIGIQGRL